MAEAFERRGHVVVAHATAAIHPARAGGENGDIHESLRIIGRIVGSLLANC